MGNDSKFPIRKNNRLNNFDYSNPGAYFLTICTLNRHNYFWNGEPDMTKISWLSVGHNCVRPQNLPLSEIGQLVYEELEAWNTIYEPVSIRSFVIMPNHIHLIVAILPEIHGRPQVVPTVDRMVKQFKGVVTKNIGFSIWQNSFYDHIIRNPDDYHECTKYILNNPLRYYYRKLSSLEENK